MSNVDELKHDLEQMERTTIEAFVAAEPLVRQLGQEIEAFGWATLEAIRRFNIGVGRAFGEKGQQ